MAAKMAQMRTPGWEKANPRAVPRKGALHGVARMVASTPLRKLPARPGRPAAALQPRPGARQPHAEHPEEAEAQDEDEDGHDRHEAGILELEAPADLLAAVLEQDDEGGQDQEGGHDPPGEGQAQMAGAAALLAGLGDQAQDLEGDHRQHAGHEIEYQPPQRREKQVERQGAGETGARRRGEIRAPEPGSTGQVQVHHPEARLLLTGEAVEHHPLQRTRVLVSHRLQAETQPHPAVLLERLCRTSRRSGGAEGEEVHHLRLGPGCLPGPGHRQIHPPARGAAAHPVVEAQLRLQGPGNPRPEAPEDLLVCESGPARVHRQVEGHGGLSRDADLPAHQPGNPGGKAQGGVRRQRRRRGYRGDQHHLAGISVDGEAAFLAVPGGQGPLQGRGGEARGQAPVDLGGQARGPAELPVGVPALVGAQLHPQAQGAPGDDRRDVGQEPGLHRMVSGGGWAESGAGARCQQEGESQETRSAHG